MKKYFWNLLISFDQFVNTVFGGDPDETISSRLGKWARDGRNNSGIRKYIWQIAHWVVEHFEEDHFAKSIERDEGKDQTFKD